MKYLLRLSLITSLITFIGCTKAPAPITPEKLDNSTVVVATDADVTVVTTDAYGKDFPDIARYPNSIRIYYADSELETNVIYQTTAQTEVVRSYFDDLVTKAGWTISSQGTDYMEYTRGDRDNPEILTVYFTEYATQQLLEYELVYEPALTEAEQAQ